MRRSIGLAGAGLALLALGGCTKKGGGGGDAMKLLPKETGVVVAINLDKLRGSKPWERLTKLRDGDAKTKEKYDELVKGLGFDPMIDGKAVTIGVPADTSKGRDDFAMVFDTNKALDEKKFVAYASETAKKEGAGELKTEQYGGKTLYGNAKKDDSWVVFLSDKQLAVAGKEAIKKVVDLSAGKGEGADKNAELTGLAGRADKGAGIWAAGSIPADKRGNMMPGATVSGGALSVDFASGLAFKAEADTASADEAKKLSEQATQQLAQAKANPMVAMMGFQGPVDATKISAAGKAIKVETKMDAAKFEELMTKLEGMAKMMGGMPFGAMPAGERKMGNPGGPGMGGPGMGGPGMGGPGMGGPSGPPGGMKLKLNEPGAPANTKQ